MRVVCRSGHFAFYPEARDDVMRFKRLTGVNLYGVEDYFTFLALKDLPRWSQTGRLFGNLPALLTYEGREPWDVMSENDFVHSLATGLLVPRTTIVETLTLPQTNNYAIAPWILVQPGTFFTVGVLEVNVLTGYQGHIDLSTQRLYLYDLETLL